MADPLDPPTVDRWELRQLELDAAAYRYLCSSPHVAELIAEWFEWDRRRVLNETSRAVATAWHPGRCVPSYAVLQRRRGTYRTPALTPAQIRAQAAASWAHLNQAP
jgi:hypothetical protein